MEESRRIRKRSILTVCVMFFLLLLLFPFLNLDWTEAKEEGNTYSFLSVDATGEPERWNPCLPITWSVVPESFPRKDERRVKEVFNTISRATGLTFTYLGPATNYTLSPVDPFPGLPSRLPSIPGADIALSWDSFTDTTPNDTGKAAYAGRSIVEDPVTLERFASLGYARFNMDYLRWYPPYLRTALYLHEIGHIIGLGHAEGNVIMNADIMEVGGTKYKKGDLAGLRLLGRQAGECG